MSKVVPEVVEHKEKRVEKPEISKGTLRLLQIGAYFLGIFGGAALLGYHFNMKSLIGIILGGGALFMWMRYKEAKKR